MINICDCDVKDKERLALFRLKRYEWLQCLIEDTFSISKQISNMLWNDTVFRTINEARRLTANRGLKTLGFNGPLLELFDQGYATAQVMAIRGITDPTFHDPSRAVISLPRLIDDMRQNADLITRENFICYQGISFEGVTHEKEGIDWMHWKRRHEIFDRLSKVSPDKRERTDRIAENVFKSLAKELKICEGLRTYANKFIAHASDTRNRVNLTEKQRNITLQKLDESYKAIIRVASFMGELILYQHSLGGVPVPQFNQLENLDKPMVLRADLADLSSFWHDRTKEVGSWENDLWGILKA
jgi:hypothetical protein